MHAPRSCLILGSGMGGLALGALLARAGVQVTILEAHPELIGGCAHSFEVDGYRFTAGPRYLWNFGPGQIGHCFLKKCELLDRVPMAELDRTGFDHVYVGDEEPIRIPNGWEGYGELLQERFPQEAAAIERFFKLCRRVFAVIEHIDEKRLYFESMSRTFCKSFLHKPITASWMLRHKRLTVDQAFRKCGLSPQVRAILFGHAAVFAHPADRLSFYAYVAGTLFYHRGCYYPKNDMAGFIGALRETIEKRNGAILTNRRVVSAKSGRHGIEQVTTHDGESYSADAVVVNFDPRSFLAMIDPDGSRLLRRFPNYKHSPSMGSLFLGVTDAGILQPSLGRWNVWYWSSSSAAADFTVADPEKKPALLYLNSPTLVKGTNDDAPPGHATVTAFFPCSYDRFKHADATETERLKEQHKSSVLATIEERFVPRLQAHVGACLVRTPVDKERIWHAPGGNVYGRSLEPREFWMRVPFKGVVPQLYFAGHYVTFAGIASVIHGACRLYEELTGDRV